MKVDHIAAQSEECTLHGSTGAHSKTLANNPARPGSLNLVLLYGVRLQVAEASTMLPVAARSQ
eukprot:11189994-Lingulodinium_polyedra.AAC.1